MKLLIETAQDIQFITEGDEKKHLYINGVFMQSEIVNKNNRRYRKDIMEKEVNRYVKEMVEDRRAYGECDHPPGPTIKLKDSAILIKELKMDGNNVIGKARVMDTPGGQIIKAVIEAGANLGVSSRALGSLKADKTGIMEVQEDFHLITAADCVSNPSAHQAFVNGLMENVEFINEGGEWKILEKLEDTRKMLKKMTTDEIDEAAQRLFESFLHFARTKSST